MFELNVFFVINKVSSSIFKWTVYLVCWMREPSIRFDSSRLERNVVRTLHRSTLRANTVGIGIASNTYPHSSSFRLWAVRYACRTSLWSKTHFSFNLTNWLIFCLTFFSFTIRSIQNHQNGCPKKTGKKNFRIFFQFFDQVYQTTLSEPHTEKWGYVLFHCD